MTDGEIICSKIEEEYDSDGGGGYKAAIQYKYTIGEKEYFSNRIFYGNNILKTFPKSVKNLVTKYAKGEKVIVYYNPRYPNMSVLETGVHAVIYRALFTGLLLLLSSIIVLVINK